MLSEGIDLHSTDMDTGIAISADGKFIYFTPLSSRDLYRVETSALRGNTNNDSLAFLRAANSVQYLGEVGFCKCPENVPYLRPRM